MELFLTNYIASQKEDSWFMHNFGSQMESGYICIGLVVVPNQDQETLYLRNKW